jgi:hypothetical protein
MAHWISGPFSPQNLNPEQKLNPKPVWVSKMVYWFKLSRLGIQILGTNWSMANAMGH